MTLARSYHANLKDDADINSVGEEIQKLGGTEVKLLKLIRIITFKATDEVAENVKSVSGVRMVDADQQVKASKP